MPCVANNKGPTWGLCCLLHSLRVMNCAAMFVSSHCGSELPPRVGCKGLSRALGAHSRAPSRHTWLRLFGLIVLMLMLLNGPCCCLAWGLVAIVTTKRLTEMQLNYAIVPQSRPYGIPRTGHRRRQQAAFCCHLAGRGANGGRKKRALCNALKYALGRAASSRLQAELREHVVNGSLRYTSLVGPFKLAASLVEFLHRLTRFVVQLIHVFGGIFIRSVQKQTG